MSKKAILFDLDGTLTDSGEGIMNSATLVLEHYGIPVPSREELRSFVGPPLRESFLRYGIPEEQIPTAIEVFRSRYTTIGKYENFPYPGIKELLAELQAAGHDLYVATSKPEVMAVEILGRFELSQYFIRICGSALDESRGSKAEVIAYLLSQTDNQKELVMVGDTEFDVIGAKAHGIPTIGVAWGYGKVEAMESAGAVSIARTPEELFELLQQ